jgi:hypothetical protein
MNNRRQSRLWISMTRFEVGAPVLACRHAGRGLKGRGADLFGAVGPKRQSDKERKVPKAGTSSSQLTVVNSFHAINHMNKNQADKHQHQTH